MATTTQQPLLPIRIPNSDISTSIIINPATSLPSDSLITIDGAPDATLADLNPKWIQALRRKRIEATFGQSYRWVLQYYWIFLILTTMLVIFASTVHGPWSQVHKNDNVLVACNCHPIKYAAEKQQLVPSSSPTLPVLSTSQVTLNQRQS